MHLGHLAGLLRMTGCTVAPADLDAIRAVLAATMREAWAWSQHASVVVRIRVQPGAPFELGIDWRPATVAASYDALGRRRKPLLGRQPDARVVDLAATLGEPSRAAVVDLGAGNGRNAIALARAGHPVTAVEFAPSLATAISAAAARERLPLEVRAQDLFDAARELRSGHYALAILSQVVPEFRGLAQLRAMLEVAARLLKPGGLLLFNSFVAADAITLSERVRQQCEARRSSVYTRSEIRQALSDHGLAWLRECHAHDYERAHLPPQHWPPTGWFVNWSRGRDVFATRANSAAPVELYWIEAERRD